MSVSIDRRVRLCSRCKNLDIAGVRSSTHPRQSLGPVAAWHTDTCDLCKFLDNLLSRDHSDSRTEKQEYFLFSIKTSHKDVSDRLLQILDHRLIVLSTSQNGPPPGRVPYIAAHVDEPPPWLKYIQPLIDFEQPKEWLNICAELHGDSCSGDKSSSMAHNLTLIDCITGEIVTAGDKDPYVALSYVWGDEDASTRDSHAYPRTVQDAMVATRELGYRWLWVDKYCIDQNNPHNVHDQLQQMDMIYRQAAVTIIAAAGTNAHYGLPGVNESYRKPALPVRVHDERLYEIPKPERRLDNCRWTTRAWTYQEGLLSTRRLIFTDQQLYFECNGCYCAEMIQIPVESFTKLHAPDKPYFHKRYRGEGNRMGTFPLNGYGVDPWDIYTRISEYSERSLSHDSDILNGILGIFRAFEKTQNPMRHLYGIPFPKATTCPNEIRKFRNSDQVLPTFSESLSWSLEVPSKRRQGFPSWSWTGWYGRINWPTLFTDVKIVRKSSKMERPRLPEETERAIDLSIELRSGHKMRWTEFQDDYESLLASDALTGFIFIDAHATPVALIPGMTDSGLQSSRFGLNLAEGFYPVLASITTVEELRPQGTLLAIHFHRTVKRNQGRGGMLVTASVTQHLLIVQQLGSHWERVAIGSFVVDPEIKVPSTRQRIRLG